MSEGYLEPVVATAVFDVAGFLDGAKKAVGATGDLTGSLDKAGIAAAKSEAAISQAALRAAASQDKAAAAAARAAKAQEDAGAAAQKAATGELSVADAADKAATAQDLAQRAARLQAQAALDAQKALIVQAGANDTVARSAGVATKAQAEAAAATVGVATKTGEAATVLGARAGVLGKAATTVRDNWVLAAGVIGFEAVKMAGNFEQQTNVLVTAAGESQKNLGSIRNGILNIAETTGTAWQQVTQGIYVAEKAGYRGADALNVVKASAEGAREENANLATVLNATTSVLASYGLKASDSVRVTNEIKTAAGEAKTTMEQFAGSLSTVLPVASKAGISFADVAGVIATLTQHGTSADEATQEIANAIRNLQAPNNVAVKEMAQLGISALSVEQNLGKRGLSGTLEYLSNTINSKTRPDGTILLSTFNASKIAAQDAATEFNALPSAAQAVAKAYSDGTLSLKDYRTALKALPADQASLVSQYVTTENAAKGFQQALRTGNLQTQTATQALKLLTGGANGLNVVLQATGSQSGATADRVKRISDAAKNAGADVAGWKTTQHNFNVELDQFKQRLAAAGIHLGQDLIPPLKEALTVLNAHPAILQAAAAGVGLLVVRWGALKALGLAEWLGGLTTKLFGLAAAEDAAAVSARGLAGAEGAAGAAGAAEGAGAGLGGVARDAEAAGSAFARSGLLRGGVVAVGITALAAASKQLFDAWSVHNLPAANALGKAIASGGLTGNPATNLVTQSLAAAKVGDNRGESQLQYFQRITANGGGAPFGLSMQSLFDTIEKGNRTAFAAFLVNLDMLAKKTGANASTVQNLNDYYTALFNRFNTGRVASQGLTAAQEKLGESLVGSSTDVSKLASTLKISQSEAQKIAAENTNWHQTQIDVNSALSETNETLTGYSATAAHNRQVIEFGALAAKNHAEAILADTGNVKLANAAFNQGIAAIEANAEKIGYNKTQVDNLIRSLGLIPPDPTSNVHVNGIPEAEGALAGLMQSLRDLAQPIIIPIETQSSLVGVASPSYVPSLPQILTAQGQADGGIHPRGVPGGIVQWAEAGGESYIPHAPSKRARALDIWQKTGAILGVTKMAEGGILQDLSILGNYTHAQNELLAYNKATFSKATAANVPGLELAAVNAAAVAKAVGAYFDAHKRALWAAAHSGPATQRKAAGSLYNELASFAHVSQSDAAQEASLAAQLRLKFAGQEYAPVRFGRPTQDLSYLALRTAANAPTTPSYANVTTVVQLDKQPILKVVQQHALRSEKRGLSNGLTSVRRTSGAGGTVKIR